MATSFLQKELRKRAANIDALAARIARQPARLAEVLEGLSADKPGVKDGCLKLPRRISERTPAVVYPETARLITLLDSENSSFQWGAIIVLGNLAAVDSDQKLDRILDRYLRPIPGPVLVTAATVIGGAAKIARAKPRRADRIARALMQAEAANYRTPECRNAALGEVADAFGLFFDHVKKQRPVLELIQRQLKNRRNAVRRKAAAFLQARRIGGRDWKWRSPRASLS